MTNFSIIAKKGVILFLFSIFLSCSVGHGISPVGNPEEFQAKPLEIYVELGVDEGIYRFPEADVIKNGNSASPEPADSVQSFPIWAPLVAGGSEMPGWGMYTYVLIGRNIGSGNPLEEAALDRYRKLMLILSEPFYDVSEARIRSEANIFFIPAKSEKDGALDGLPDYNRELADRLLAQFAEMLQQEGGLVQGLMARPGPFLISILRPIERLFTTSARILFADLSDSKPADMVEIVQSYNLRVDRESESDMIAYGSLRLKLFNVIPNTDANLKIVRTRP